MEFLNSCVGCKFLLEYNGCEDADNLAGYCYYWRHHLSKLEKCQFFKIVVDKVLDKKE